MLRRRKIAVFAAIGLAVMGGVAFALWSTSGGGSGRARALTAQSVTVTATTGTADLYPGFTGGDLSFTLTNANPYAVTFTDMTAGAVTSSDPTGCPATNVTVGNATGLAVQVGASTTSGTLTIPDVVSMAAGAPDACQGVQFDVTVTLTGTQS